jgi:hypothetical protein
MSECGVKHQNPNPKPPVDNTISRRNNLLYHILSYVLFLFFFYTECVSFSFFFFFRHAIICWRMIRLVIFFCTMYDFLKDLQTDNCWSSHWQTSSHHIILYGVHLVWAGFELATYYLSQPKQAFAHNVFLGLQPSLSALFYLILVIIFADILFCYSFLHFV